MSDEQRTTHPPRTNAQPTAREASTTSSKTNQTGTDLRLAYSPTELARALGCSRQHIQNMIARGELPSFKLGAKRLIPADVVQRLIAAAGSDDHRAR